MSLDNPHVTYLCQRCGNCCRWPGDVIVTGTPGGVGARRDPPVFMKPGDVVEVEVDRIGCLRNSIARD